MDKATEHIIFRVTAEEKKVYEAMADMRRIPLACLIKALLYCENQKPAVASIFVAVDELETVGSDEGKRRVGF